MPTLSMSMKRGALFLSWKTIFKVIMSVILIVMLVIVINRIAGGIF